MSFQRNRDGEREPRRTLVGSYVVLPDGRRGLVSGINWYGMATVVVAGHGIEAWDQDRLTMEAK